MTAHPPPHRFRPDGPIEGVVLLHGLARTPASLRPLERRLAAAGYRTANIGYGSRRQDLDALAAEIHPSVAAFAAGADGPVHFVTHSMGGLLARLYLALHRPPRLGRAVMLAPPHGGSAVADLLDRTRIYRAAFGPAGRQLTTRHAAVLSARLPLPDYEVGIIAGTRSVNPLASALVLREPNDGKVTVRGTRFDGMADHIVVPATHTFMMRDPTVAAATIAFLRRGRFR